MSAALSNVAELVADTEPPLLLDIPPTVVFRLTESPLTVSATTSVGALTLYVPDDVLAVFVYCPQFGHGCNVTVLALSLTFTLPFEACAVNPLAFTSAGVVSPIDPLSDTNATAVAEPVTPLIPLLLVTIVPYPAVDAVVCRKKVPPFDTVDVSTVTVCPALYASLIYAEPLFAVTDNNGLVTSSGEVQSAPISPALSNVAELVADTEPPLLLVIPPTVVFRLTAAPLTVSAITSVGALTLYVPVVVLATLA